MSRSEMALVKSVKISGQSDFVVLNNTTNLLFSHTLSYLNEWTHKEIKAKRIVISDSTDSLRYIESVKHDILKLTVDCKDLLTNYPTDYLECFSVHLKNNLTSTEVKTALLILAHKIFGPVIPILTSIETYERLPSFESFIKTKQKPLKDIMPTCLKKDDGLLSFQEVLKLTKSSTDFIFIPSVETQERDLKRKRETTSSDLVIINQKSPRKSLSIGDQSHPNLQNYIYQPTKKPRH